MARFTKRVLRLLYDEMTNTVLREIDDLFEDNQAFLGPPQPLDNDSSERRERTRRYVACLDLDSPADHAKLLAVYRDVLVGLSRRASRHDPDAVETVSRWLEVLRGEGFEIDSDLLITDPSRPTISRFSVDALSALTDPTVIHDHLARLGDSVDTDPRLAVSTAKALIESTAKLVLTARGIEYTRSAKVPALVQRSQESLSLSAKGASSELPALRQILQSLVTLAQGVAEIRNQVGVDHGAESVPTWVRPRHARLVVGAAQVWCQLMLETLADPLAPWRSEANT